MLSIKQFGYESCAIAAYAAQGVECSVFSASGVRASSVDVRVPRLRLRRCPDSSGPDGELRQHSEGDGLLGADRRTRHFPSTRPNFARAADWSRVNSRGAFDASQAVGVSGCSEVAVCWYERSPHGWQPSASCKDVEKSGETQGWVEELRKRDTTKGHKTLG